MNNNALKSRLEIVALVSSVFVVVVSGVELAGQVSTPVLIGLIAGSFGAGALTVNTVRSFTGRRREEKRKGTA